MRPKAMPISVRSAPPSIVPDARPPRRAGPRDWLATAPIILLLPALLLLVIPAAANAPRLAVNGTAIRGGTLTVVGSNFSAVRKVRLTWDGGPAATAAVRGNGTFRVKLSVPKDAANGKHIVGAFDAAAASGSDMLASVAVDVGAPAASAAAQVAPNLQAPSPKRNDKAGPTPTVAPQPTSVPPTAPPTPAATPRPTEAPTPIAPTGTVRVLCDGKTFDGYGSIPFKLDGGIYADASVLKVIRNCTFRNSSVVAIRIRNARNVLIEGNTFDNIRTRVPGDGVHAIAIPGVVLADGIVIRGNRFSRIGADGMQLGDTGRLVYRVVIEGNVFSGSEDVGENAIDVKGVNGPITIRANTWSGFRPCQSPKKGGTQDCSGSNGEGIVLHHGEVSGRATNVTVTGNVAIDNTRGIVVNQVDDVTVSGNTIRDSLEWHIYVANATGCLVGTNTFVGSAPRLVVHNADC